MYIVTAKKIQNPGLLKTEAALTTHQLSRIDSRIGLFALAGSSPICGIFVENGDFENKGFLRKNTLQEARFCRSIETNPIPMTTLILVTGFISILGLTGMAIFTTAKLDQDKDKQGSKDILH
jgi:hypothetical protein